MTKPEGFTNKVGAKLLSEKRWFPAITPRRQGIRKVCVGLANIEGKELQPSGRQAWGALSDQKKNPGRWE